MMSCGTKRRRGGSMIDANSMKTADVNPEEVFTSHYYQVAPDIESSHLALCRRMAVQADSRSHEMKYLCNKKWLYRKSQEIEEPNFTDPMRVTYFNGGKGNFPLNRWDDIWKMRAVDYENDVLGFGNDFAYSSDGIRLIFELDYRSKHKCMEKSDMLNHAMELQNMVKTFYPNNERHIDTTMCIMTCQPKPKYVNDHVEFLISSGMHIVFPYIIVNSQQGEQFQHTGDIVLQRKFGLRNVVDNCYTTMFARLRPIHSHKRESCTVCFNLDDFKGQCEYCIGRGKVTSPSTYGLSMIIDGSGNSRARKLAEMDVYAKMKLSSIVNIDRKPTCNFNIPRNVEKLVPLPKCKSKCSHIPIMISQRSRGPNEPSANNLSTVTDVGILESITKIVETYGMAYKGTCVDEVKYNKTMLYITLKGNGMKYCNVKTPPGNHGSNRIRFIINRKNMTLTQSCFNLTCVSTLKDTIVYKRVTRVINYREMFARVNKSLP
jgi:hypothetical protein